MDGVNVAPVEPPTEVPFVELGGDFPNRFKARLLPAFGELLDSGAFINGPPVAQFEEAFAPYIGSAFCVGTAGGLDAPRLGLIAAGLEHGDEVIVPANTFVATPPRACKPAPCRSRSTSPSATTTSTPTRSSSPSHRGHASCCPSTCTARWPTYAAYARSRKRGGLLVFEDACQAHGASRDGLRAGTVGIAGDLPGVTTPPGAEGSKPVWHLYVARVPDTDALAEFLSARGIETGRHYPVPAHLTPAYASLGYGHSSFPVTEQLSRELLSLPLFPGVERGQLDRVVEGIGDFLDRG